MAGFDDLVGQVTAPPSVAATAAENSDWAWTFINVNDQDGAAIDLSAATWDCQIRDKVDGQLLVQCGVASGPGWFTVTAAAAITKGTAGSYTGRGKSRRNCEWECRATVGGKTASLWGVSPFTILQELGA